MRDSVSLGSCGGRSETVERTHVKDRQGRKQPLTKGIPGRISRATSKDRQFSVLKGKTELPKIKGSSQVGATSRLSKALKITTKFSTA
jgi:hypothetical protein